MDIGSDLEGAIHTGDEGHLFLELFQRLKRIRPLNGLETHLVSHPGDIFDRWTISYRNVSLRFSREESPANHPNGHVEEGHPLSGSRSTGRERNTFHPRKRQNSTPGSTYKRAPGYRFHRVG